MRKIFFLVLIFAFFAVAYLAVGKFGADSNPKGKVVSREKLNLQNSNFELLHYLNDQKNTFVLTKKSFLTTESVVLSPFSDEVKLCKNPTPTIGDRTAICLKGLVGPHSEALGLINPTDLSPIRFLTE